MTTKSVKCEAKGCDTILQVWGNEPYIPLCRKHKKILGLK